MNQVIKMTEHVKNGGVFTIDNVPDFHPDDSVFPLIRISRFSDGSLYLHDGHHRAASIWIGGRDWLMPEEYEIQDWDSIKKYDEINFASNWVTPLDLINEVRLPDTRIYKRLIQDAPTELKTELVHSLKHMYATGRVHDNVVDMARDIAKFSNMPLRNA
jgi:hypothetical protein